MLIKKYQHIYANYLVLFFLKVIKNSNSYLNFNIVIQIINSMFITLLTC